MEKENKKRISFFMHICVLIAWLFIALISTTFMGYHSFIVWLAFGTISSYIFQVIDLN